MRSSKALVLTIAWIGVIFVAGRNDIFICTDEFGEPSISDIVMNLIPNVPGMSKDPRVRLAKSLEHLDMGNVSVLSMMESALRISVPVKSFVSDGVFTLTYASANYEYTFNDVSLVQKKNSVLEFVCGYEFIGDTFSSLCDCGGGLLAIDKYHRDQYCVRNSVCSDKSVVDGVCKIMMNPFENGCLMISVRSEGSKEAQEVEDLVRGSVVFELVVPSLSNVWKFLSNFFFAQEANQNPNIFRHYNNFGKHGVVPELLEKIMYFSSVTLQNLPLYPINLLMGYLIVTNARDMTDSPFVQLIMQSMYGLFLAFIVLAYFLYR